MFAILLATLLLTYLAFTGKLGKRAGLLATGLFTVVSMRADPPEYAGAAFDQMQEVLDDGALFFGALIAVAIIIIGFIKGRAWFRRV